MKNTVLFVTIFLVLLTQCAAVSAQIGGDPTNQNRYIILAPSKDFTGAEMVKKLPAGATCQEAGEIAGYKYWNSTGKDRANLVELTEQSQVAVDKKNRQLYLCYCGGENDKFNKLFPVAKGEVPPSTREVTREVSQQDQQQDQKQEINFKIMKLV